MKIFKIRAFGEWYAVCGNDRDECLEHFKKENDLVDDKEIESCNEVLPVEWEKHKIIYTEIIDEETGKPTEISYAEFMDGQTETEVFCSTEWI